MPLDIARTRQILKAFDFKGLFVEELGWDHCSNHLQITIDGTAYNLSAVAEKHGMVAFICSPSLNGGIPDYSLRRKMERQAAKSVHEHIIIYADGDKTTQVWQWVKRETGKPTACREHTFHVSQDGLSLIQKLQTIVFSLEEEETLTIVEVSGRARAAFDVERITKRFYDRFKAEHDIFLKFIEGIPDGELHRWYASVMLNRLMFIYFIQKKGFLDRDEHYLRNRLHQSEQKGKDSFYEKFLCPLFFEGFAKKERERSPEINKLLGAVPYLNGGLFLKHQIEELHGRHIEIADKAFEKLFDFFDQYQWHLDERPLKRDNEINPDVLGYIFEKYINQKQMGAYYTKEDITEYISKNTVIPFLFDSARQKCEIAFEGEQSIWRLLQADPDRYFYPAVKKGVKLPLPEEIVAGVQDVSKRTDWNRSAPTQYALPTEIWREVISRRQRYEEIKERMVHGKLQTIDDLITCNLDIRQFAQDVIWNAEGPELIMAFYQAIEELTVLDPTCGSGAFLFAALNILEPLYEACLDRMQVFVEEFERSNDKGRPDKYSDFRKILKRVSEHQNPKYFIFKSIIVNNLYGVDIMEEAVEICKLRFFLKLVAQIDKADDIEPLPDIDFNVRAGNSLVGFATYEEVKHAVTSKLDFENSMKLIEEHAQDVDRLFQRFHQQQTELRGEAATEDKIELKTRLKELEDMLNHYLAGEYGVNPGKKTDYRRWIDSHKPFHWFIEFYRILKDGGFDVIIGNPPYVEYKNIADYRVLHYKTEKCGDLYAYILERSMTLSLRGGRSGFIVPMSCFAVEGFAPLQQVYFENTTLLYISNWSGDAHPSRLFEGVDKRLEIVLSKHGSYENGGAVFGSKYLKWYADERPHLFHIAPIYHSAEPIHNVRFLTNSIPKLGTPDEVEIGRKLRNHSQTIGHKITPTGRYHIYYTRKVSFFLQFLNFVPEVRDGKGQLREPSELKTLFFNDETTRDLCLACLTSSIFYWYNIISSDCRNLNKREIISFPLPHNIRAITLTSIKTILSQLMEDYKRNATPRTVDYANKGNITVQYFNFRPSKPIIDTIDRVIAKHYGLTEEELDFIINYDIKYRMGRDNEEENS